MKGEFSKAVENARSVICSDREGLFCCHTVDPYVDAMVRAHTEEMADMKAEVSRLHALLRGLRKIIHGVPYESLHAPWIAYGTCAYLDRKDADGGDLVANFEDSDGVTATETVCVVNAFNELREHIDKFFGEDADGSEG